MYNPFVGLTVDEAHDHLFFLLETGMEDAGYLFENLFRVDPEEGEIYPFPERPELGRTFPTPEDGV